jgi:hypothetical protein
MSIDIIQMLKGTETQLRAKTETILSWGYENGRVWKCLFCKKTINPKEYPSFEDFSNEVTKHSYECTKAYLNRERTT